MQKLLLTGCLLIAFSACENSEQDINKIRKRNIGKEEALDVRAIYTTAGKTKAILTSPLMYRVQDSVYYYEFPNAIHVDFYGENGAIESTLDSKYARYTDASGIVFLKDSIKVVGLVRGDTLYCEELYWDRDKKGTEFYTDKPVRIRRMAGDDVRGRGMEASQDFKNWHIITPLGDASVPAGNFPQ